MSRRKKAIGLALLTYSLAVPIYVFILVVLYLHTLTKIATACAYLAVAISAIFIGRKIARTFTAEELGYVLAISYTVVLLPFAHSVEALTAVLLITSPAVTALVGSALLWESSTRRDEVKKC